MQSSRRRTQLLAAVFILTLSACGGAGDSGVAKDPNAPAPDPGGTISKPLTVALTCPELLESLVADARMRLDEELAALRRHDQPVLFAQPLPSVEDAGIDNGTQTNVQVAGVDEADTIEFHDGWIHILQARRGSQELISVSSETPELLAVEMSMELQGEPAGMFVDNGRAVVFSRLYDAGPEFGNAEASACAYVGNLGANNPKLAQPADIAYCGPSFTRVSVIDLTPPQHTIVREFTIAGSYVSARRHGEIVRVVTTGGVQWPTGVSGFWASYNGNFGDSDPDAYNAAIDNWEAQTRATLNTTALEDWLPAAFERQAGSDWQRLGNACGDVALPEEGTTRYGMTRIFGLNMMEDSGAVADNRILGGGQAIYANSAYFVLSQEDWAAQREAASNQTQLHLFAIGSEGTALGYIDSANVDGIPHNQFSFDIRDDVLRVSTTIWRTFNNGNDIWRTEQVNRIHTLRIGADWLTQIGSTPDLAPGESIYATRFFEDTGYLVTFRQIDPLFAIDLSDPENPEVLGELELPGFSEYIHMLGEDHLLTVGRAGDADGTLGGVALRVFDVSDPTQPVLRDELIPNGADWTPASYDHRAFTFRESDGLLVLPFASQSTVGSTNYSYLQIFDVDTNGIQPAQRISHPVMVSAPPGPGVCRPEVVPCGVGPGSYSATMRRGLLRGDAIYSISSVFIKSHLLSDVTQPLATAELQLQDGPLQ
jgi:hypothetical protein